MQTYQIPLLDLVAQYRSIQPEIDAAIQRVLVSGRFILGEEVVALEDEVAAYLGADYCVGVASGTDALILALRALEIGPGDEVIIPAYTFFATIGAILHVGATPVLVDIDADTYCLDVAQVRQRINPATKAVVPVHLFGHPADMISIKQLAQEFNLHIIEDNAQAFGSEYQVTKTGALGDIGCLSFFPSKNLGAYGDGGMVAINNLSLAENIRKLRTHGWKKKYFPEVLGYNSRLDAFQAAILRAKLNHLDAWNDRRREIAEEYSDRLANIPGIKTPIEVSGSKHVYHLYVIQTPDRDKVSKMLNDAGVASGIYYPQPIHLAQPCRDLGYVDGDFPVSERASRETLAIPIFPEMDAEQIDIVIKTLGDRS